MRDEIHPAAEEYLQTIGFLVEEGAPVIQARIAQRMGKSAPSVREMLDRLVSSGYVQRSGRQIALTEAGQAQSRSVIRRHRLAERLVVDVIGLPWRDAHAEAERFEHVLSDEVMERLVELLGDPATCPHGNPIPGSASPMPDLSRQIRLADAEPDQAVRLARLSEEVELDPASLAYLDEAGFVPGADAVVRARTPDGTLVLEVSGSTLALGPHLSERLFVAVG
jgi:DtxR family transcriptional regulator, Mn-dependent transcriptional regulator